MKNIADRVISEGFALPMVIVMPDARGEAENKAGKNMGYFNLPGWDYEDFFFREFIPFIEGNNRIAAEKKSRAIAGLSMGGGGAAVYAQRYPQYFSSACLLSALVGRFESSAAASVDPVFREMAEETSPVDFVRAATASHVDSLESVRWYVDCGDDDYLLSGNWELVSEMKAKKIPVEFRVRDGAHTWEYWRSALPSVLQFVSIGFSRR